MSLEVDNGSSNSRIYLSIVRGKLTQRVDPNTEGAKSRFTEKGERKEIWEKVFKAAEGKVVALNTKDSDFGLQAIIALEDTNEEGEPIEYHIQFPMLTQGGSVGRYATTFIKHLPNIDFEKPLRVAPYSFADKENPEKTITGFSLGQGGNKISPFFTSEAPNGMPAPKERNLPGGKKVLDWADVTEFLLKIWEEHSQSLAALRVAPEAEAQPETQEDGLPF